MDKKTIQDIWRYLIDCGQSDTEKFKLGDTIRFKPSQVADLLEKMPEDEPEEKVDHKVYPKPPLGVAPYQIVAQGRICDLAEAIARYASEGSYKPIEKWAREIIEQCSLVEYLKNLEMDEE